MAYRSVCYNLCWPIEWISHFSNPSISYQGVPTGTALDNIARHITESKLGTSMTRYRNQKGIYNSYLDGVSVSYFNGASFEFSYFDVVAKTAITITNFELHLTSARYIEVYIVTGTWDQVTFSASNLVASETVTPLSATNPSKLEDIGIFNSFSGKTVAAGQRVAVLIKMIGGNVRIASASSLSVGDTVLENDDVSITVGQMSTSTFFYKTRR